MEYVCERRHFNKRLFRVGEVVDLQEEQLPKDKNGKVLFFRLLNEVKAEEEIIKPEVKCDWCEAVYKSDFALRTHKRFCKMNPDLIGISR
jgi:hypothetical protein